MTYDQIGKWSDGTPRFQATQSLSAAGKQLQTTSQKTQQNLAGLAQEQSGRLSGILNQNLNFGNLPQAGTVANGPQLQTSLGSNDFSADRDRVETAMFSRLNPQIDRQREQFETSLTNRGIRPGSDAYKNQVSDFNQSLNDQRTSILLQGGQEQSRLQGMALNSGNFANSALQQQYNNASNQFGQQNALRQNAMSEMITQRQLPLQEILALAGQGQLQQPQFTNTPQTGVAGTDIAGITNAAYGQQMQAYNAGQQTLGGLFSAGASLIPLLSDIRVKDNIKRVGSHPVGVGVYEYDRLDTGEREVGVMAQELLSIRPDMVNTTSPDGYLRVYYWKLNQEFPDAHV